MGEIAHRHKYQPVMFCRHFAQADKRFSARLFRVEGQIFGCPVCALFLLAIGGIFLLAKAVPATAQEPSGLQAALALESALADAIARTEKSVVAIARGRNPKELKDPDYIPTEYATGVVVDVINGRARILTNYHVLGDPQTSKYVIWADRRAFDAEVAIKGASSWVDLAILEVNIGDSHSLQPITFGDGANLRKGQIVISLGNPHAIARDGRPSAGWGIISNLQRKAPPDPDPSTPDGVKGTLHHFGTLIQTDARLNQGTSGGALLNLKGEMIGLTTSLATVAGYEKSAGYAIPVDETFRRTVDALRDGKAATFGFLGVAPASLTPEERADGLFGVRLQQVVRGTPAAEAVVRLVGEPRTMGVGLRMDDIVTHIDNQPLYFRDDLFLQIGSLPPRQVVRLTVLRGNDVLNASVTLSKKYNDSRRPDVVTAPVPAWRGMRVDDATAVLRRDVAFDLDGTGKVAVQDVDRDSPAWKAGLRPMDLVTHVDATRIITPEQFYDLVGKLSGPVKLRVVVDPGQDPVRTVLP